MRLHTLGFRVLCAGALLFSSMFGNPARAARPHPLKIQAGLLTIDGLPAKTQVDLRIPDLHYLYLYIPGSGTAVVSEHAFPGASEQRAAFRNNTLTVTAADHRLQLTAINRMRSTRSVYVRFDEGTGPATRLPAVGYGDAAMIPAVWPDMTPGTRGRGMRLRRASHRPLRTAKLCRPSAHGRELCATVREVVYKP